MTATDPVMRTGARTVMALLLAVSMFCSLTVLTVDVQAVPDATEYKVYPTSAYPNQTVEFSIELTNTGDKPFTVMGAVYEINWVDSTTTVKLTDNVSIAKGGTVNLTGSFVTPDVSPGTYVGNVSVTALETLSVNALLTYEANFTIKEVQPLKVSISASPGTGSVPLNVTFTSTVAGGVGPYTYAWSAGDGSAGRASTFVHRYSAVGDYNATLVVIDDRGKSASANTTIKVEMAKLQASIQATKVSGLAPLATTITSNVSGGITPYTYSWTTGDGGTYDGRSFTYEYHEPGTYTVRLLVTDDAGNTARDLITIVVLSQSEQTVDPVVGTPLEFGPMLIGYIFVFVVASVTVVGFMVYRNRTRFRRR